MRIDRARDLDHIALAAEVASLVPAGEVVLARRNARNSQTHGRRMLITICPRCGGDKSRTAMTCRACCKAEQGDRWRSRSNRERIDAQPHQPVAYLDVRSTRYTHTAGSARPQPQRPRMVLVEGAWVVAEDGQ